MKFFRKAKDGGPESTVTGYWLAEIKSLFSIVSRGTTWVLSLRGPWTDTWREYVDGAWKTLTHGRKEL